MDSKASGFRPDPDGGETAAMEYFEKKTPSVLPYHITRHRRVAKLRFMHARSKEHALKHLDIRTGWLALFWLIVFGVVMTCLVLLLRDLFLTYFSNPIATQILTEHTQLLFPDVTICPVSPFSKSSMTPEELLEMDDLKQQVISKLVYAGLHLTDANIQAAMLIQLGMKSNRSPPEGFKHLVYCQYNGEPCSFANFTETVHLRYMRCYTFSPQTDGRNLTAGTGLSLIYLAEQNGSSSDPYMLLNDLESAMFNETAYDGINVFVHHPNTFPGYEINQMPTSFAVHFGQIVRVEVSGLRYQSSIEGSKRCVLEHEPFMYKSFGGSSRYLEYEYTYKDCVANRKQSHILEECGCYSDLLQVPYIREPDDDPMAKGIAKFLDFSKMKVDFCRDVFSRTSQRARRNFECHERLIKMPTSKVLDAYVNPDLLYNARDDPDMTKKLRQAVCPVKCSTMLYDTKNVYLTELHENFTLYLPVMTKHLMDLNLSTIAGNSTLHQMWYNMTVNNSTLLEFSLGSNLAIVDVRLSRERVDVWHEQVTSSLFGLMANIGGTLSLCAGISFLSAFFLVLFFGSAAFHAIMALVYWFWWIVFQGGPKAAEIDSLMAAEAHSVAIGKRITAERPYSSRHMRAVSRILVEEKKSAVFDPWAASRIQYNLKLGDSHIPNKEGNAFNSPNGKFNVAGDGEQSPKLPALMIGTERVSYRPTPEPGHPPPNTAVKQEQIQQFRASDGAGGVCAAARSSQSDENVKCSIDAHLDSMLKKLRRLPSTRSRCEASPDVPECVHYECEENEQHPQQSPCTQVLSCNEMSVEEIESILRRRKPGCGSETQMRLDCEEITEPKTQHFIAHPTNVEFGYVTLPANANEPQQTQIQVEEVSVQPIGPPSHQQPSGQCCNPSQQPPHSLTLPQQQVISGLPLLTQQSTEQQGEQCTTSTGPQTSFGNSG